MSDFFTPDPVKGLKTNNLSAPIGDNVGVLSAIASSSTQSFTEGNQVSLITDLGGNLKVTFSTSTVLNTVLTDGSSPIGTNTNPLVVTNTDNKGSAKSYSTITSALAAGSTATLSSIAVTTGKTGYLTAVHLTSSVRQKWTIQAVTAGSPATVANLFVMANDYKAYFPGNSTQNPVAGGVTSNFATVVKNMDNINAADFYVTFEWVEV